jgi:hypothetical protein
MNPELEWTVDPHPLTRAARANTAFMLGHDLEGGRLQFGEVAGQCSKQRQEVKQEILISTLVLHLHERYQSHRPRMASTTQLI